MPNPRLTEDESFIEDCRMSEVPDHLLELVYCYGCHKMWPESELSGGYCRECADPMEEENDPEELTTLGQRFPALVKRGGNQSTTGLEPADGPTIAPAAADVKA